MQCYNIYIMDTPLRKILTSLSEELGIKCELFPPDNWTMRLSKNNHEFYVLGNSFDANSADQALLYKDKAATYSVLDMVGIPAIPHFFIESTNAITTYPTVIKPCHGNAGEDVFLCKNPDEATKAINIITTHNDLPCYSPFIDADFEYRNFYLDGNVIFCYKKERHNDWQHNLCHGATPVLLDQNSNIYKSITALAKQTGDALNAKFVTIDILEAKNGVLKVLEVNGNVSIDIFTERAPQGYEIAKDIYRQALQNLLQ